MENKNIALDASDHLWQPEDLFCTDLSTRFQSDMGRILVSGASGYIGGRLVRELLFRGYRVRAMVRSDPAPYLKLWPMADVVQADALRGPELERALSDIDTAYYLIHSLRLGSKKFAAADILAAENFSKAAEKMRVRRIIFLSGLGDVHSSLSHHLRSRSEVARRLSAGMVPATILRAAVIVGSGSASYEIMQHLTRRLKVIFLPRWARNRCQPIAIRDVIKYLVGVLETPKTAGRSFDIGGVDILTYESMLRIMSKLYQKRTFFVSLPFSNIRFFAYIASLLTPVPATITACLMEGLKNEVICENSDIKRLVPLECTSYEEAIVRAMSREEQDKVYTRWSDAHPSHFELAIKLHELGRRPAYTARYSLSTEKQAQRLFQMICKVGGREGWFHSDWLWRLRGAIDRILLGAGSVRGKKSYPALKINDTIDFWRIEDLRPNARLLLRAEMRLPGKAWLEFDIQEEGGSRRLSVTTFYDTHTLWGFLYWHLCLPLHHYIFHNLLREIVRRS